MTLLFTVLWAVVGVLLIAAAVVIHGLLDAGRSRRIARLGAELGLEYRRRDPRMPPAEIAGLPMFRRRRGRVRGSIDNMLLGACSGRRIIVFECDSLGRPAGHNPQTAAAVQLDGASLPAFAIWPRGFASRLLGRRRKGDMAAEMTGWIEFGDRFELHANDRARATDIFTPGLCEQLSAFDEWCIEGVGEWLLLYRHHVRCKPGELRSFMETVELITSLVEARAHSRGP